TLGIAVLQGRSFTESDASSAPRVALLNETAARFYFGDRNVVGTKIRISRPRTDQPYEIVGIVHDSRQSGLRADVPRLLYLPAEQSLDRLAGWTMSGGRSGNPATMINPIRDEIRAIGSDLLVTDVITLDEQINQTLVIERLVSGLTTVFGLLATLLACIGL